MSQKIINILYEGATEDRFAQKVLKPHLKGFGIVVKTQLLLTNKRKNFHGGMISYQRTKNDLSIWIKQLSGNKNETHYFTTMFDLYALPNDFHGYSDAKSKANCYETVQLLEEAFSNDINFYRFIPYIQLHDFEALVFCGLDYLLIEYPDMISEVESLRRILTGYDNNPERINDSPMTAPPKQVIKAFESKHHYDIPKMGEFVTSKVGIKELKDKCLHFKEWIEKLEKI